MPSVTVHSGTALIAAQPAVLLSGAAVAAGTLTGYLGRMLWGCLDQQQLIGWGLRLSRCPGPLQVYGLSPPMAALIVSNQYGVQFIELDDSGNYSCEINTSNCFTKISNFYSFRYKVNQCQDNAIRSFVYVCAALTPLPLLLSLFVTHSETDILVATN